MRRLVVVLVSMSSVLSVSVVALTPKADKGVKVLDLPSLVYEAPAWVSPFADISEAPTDIDYWVSQIPTVEHRDAEMYIVLPTIGVVSPVVHVPAESRDYDMMVAGREIDINTYLTDGVMFYPGSAPVGAEGNPVIFGHSNFFKNGEGDFKTIFADIMNLDVGVRDEIWVYRQVEDLTYEVLRYAIEQSYETVPEDVGVLQPQWGKELTVFACTNGLEGRWILKGRLIEDDEVLIPYAMRIRFLELVGRLEGLSPEGQERVRVIFLEELYGIESGMSERLETYEEKYKQYVLDWMEKRLTNKTFKS